MAISRLNLDLGPEINNLVIRVRKEILSRSLEGNFAAFFKGKGLEFAGYRKYEYGDDASLIDWAATLKSKQTMIRTFEVYKNFRVFILVDVSNSMLFSSTKKNKLKAEYAAELAANLAFAITKTNNAVGMSMFNTRLINRIFPDIGKGIMYEVTKALSTPENYGGSYDLQHVIKQVLSFIKEKALIIIISDFIGLQEGWTRYLQKLAQRNQVVGIMLRDPRDFELPEGEGQYVLEDPYSHENMHVDINQFRKLYQEYVEQEERIIKNAFHISKSGFIKISTNKDLYLPIINYFKKGMHE